MFTEPLKHLTSELHRLDLLLHREILRLRTTYQLSLDEFRGLYISDEQVNGLIDRDMGYSGPLSAVEDLTKRAEELGKANADRFPGDLPWQRLAVEFGLEPLEQDLVLLAVAPEIDIKYETLYAYLNNDIARKWPTCDLALRLLGTEPADKLNVRRHLSNEAALFSAGLLQPVPSAPQRPSWLAGGFSPAPGLSDYLLGLPIHDPRLSLSVKLCQPSTSWAEVPLAADKRATLGRISKLFKPPLFDNRAPILVFEGRHGAGAWETAAALCHDMNIALLHVDLAGARSSGEPPARLAQALSLQRRLQQAGVFLDRGHALFDKDGKPLPEVYGFLAQILSTPGRRASDNSFPCNLGPRNGETGAAPGAPPQAGGQGVQASPVFFACEPGTNWRELMKGQRFVHCRFDDPDYNTRLHLWKEHLIDLGLNACDPDLQALADRFVLTPVQIRDAAAAVLDAQCLSAEQPLPGLNQEILFAAARAQSDQDLGNLAVKVNTVQSWDDLILPPATRHRVKEVAAAIKYRHVVYSDWAFERRMATGKGLKVLFSGSSGTGKTMTASVIAQDLGLDLYKIDLSGVVSKYIGETEKNLERIFRAAHCSNAILFFDEADALFGKRSGIKDAHDRYANVEVAYLLQRMEEYAGVVILASNLSKNIDDAFSRRMHYVVDFPLPDENHREQLWRKMFPPEAPLSEDVDFRFLGKQFSIAGGDIRNVAMDAAFLAAQDGRVITMKQLIKAMARQMMKQGRIPSATDFKQYHALIGE